MIKSIPCVECLIVMKIVAALVAIYMSGANQWARRKSTSLKAPHARRARESQSLRELPGTSASLSASATVAQKTHNSISGEWRAANSCNREAARVDSPGAISICGAAKVLVCGGMRDVDVA